MLNLFFGNWMMHKLMSSVKFQWHCPTFHRWAYGLYHWNRRRVEGNNLHKLQRAEEIVRKYK